MENNKLEVQSQLSELIQQDLVNIITDYSKTSMLNLDLVVTLVQDINLLKTYDVKYIHNEELNEIKELASKDGIKDFRSSDMSYYSEKLKKTKYDLDEEYFRPYFEQQSVLDGFFDNYFWCIYWLGFNWYSCRCWSY